MMNCAGRRCSGPIADRDLYRMASRSGCIPVPISILSYTRVSSIMGCVSRRLAAAACANSSCVHVFCLGSKSMT
eukprot:1191395-Prorocentrum_minimum.AAC.7